MTRTRISALTALGTALLLGAGTGPAAAQESGSAWQSYLGCWEPEGEDQEEGMLCFVPDGDQVEMLTIVDGSIEFREPFPADGRTRTINQDGCQGTESARFSDDRRRIYTASDFACEGESPRKSTGIISMLDAGWWLDVRAMEVDGETMAWAQAYRRVDDSVLDDLGLAIDRPRSFATRDYRRGALAPLGVEDVIDATRNVHPKAVEAWVVERGQEFRGLDADDLLRLADADVPDEVIDVVVAVSFPAQFALAEGEPTRAETPRGQRVGARPLWARPVFGFYDPFYYGYGYSPFGYSYGYGYGYGSWWRGGYAPVVVHVNRTGGSGRVVAGRGYTRGSRPSAGRGTPAGSGRASVGRSGGTRSAPPASRSGGGRKAKRRGGR